MQCTKPFKAKTALVPCGSCLHCRIQRSREWAIRCLHELDSWESAQFVTLTYDEANLPKEQTLIVKDLQNFYKKLRKDLDLEGRKIKHFSCGEYGEKYGRPHYHAIVYGVSPLDKKLLQENWGKGKIKLGSVNYDSCRYVADYLLKKVTGKGELEKYGVRKPPFRIMSNGLGLDYIKRERERLIENLSFTNRGIRMGLPRYYRSKLNLDKSCFVPGALEAQKRADYEWKTDTIKRPWWGLTPKQQANLNLNAKLSLKVRDFDIA
ncbi:MAG: replication initiator protein [Microvirus sp.]|nr:MAG: replication initiator protein [Microvirus sp.]